MENKVKFNISNVHYALQKADEDDNICYCKPVKLQGAVAISLSVFGDSPLISVNGYTRFAVANNQGYKGNLDVANISDELCTEVLGEVIESDVFLENCDVPLTSFALLFEIDGDKTKTRYVLYNCFAGRSAITSQTKDSTINPQTDSIEIFALPLGGRLG